MNTQDVITLLIVALCALTVVWGLLRFALGRHRRRRGCSGCGSSPACRDCHPSDGRGSRCG